jgi:protein O-mannosyl-transferase
MWRDLLLSALIAAAVLGLYWPVGDFAFLGYDDRDDVHNPVISQGLTWDGAVWAVTSGDRANWMPLTRLSLMADFELAKDAPPKERFRYASTIVHYTNMGLHAADSVLVYLVLAILVRSRWVAVVAAGLFALHPLHVESVAWATERKDVLSTLFWLLTMGAYALYAARPNVWRYAAVVACLALGLMSKPMLVTLPFVLLLLDYWPLGRLRLGRAPAPGKTLKGGREGAAWAFPPPGPDDSWWARLRRSPWWPVVEKTPLLLLVAASSVATYVVQRSGGAMSFSDKIAWDDRLANVPVAYVTYLIKTFRPVDLAVFYPFKGGLPLWQPLGATALLAAITAAVVWQGRRRPYLAVGWFWYVGTLVPVIGFVHVGLHSMADRYTYVPHIGLFLMIVWGAADLLGGWRWGGAVLAPAAVGAMAVCAWLTHEQLPCWKNTVVLFEHDLDVAGDNATAYFNLGDAYLTGEPPYFGAAAANYKRALKLDPDLGDVHNNLGWTLVKMGNYEEAYFHYTEAIRLSPGNPSAYNNLGLWLVGRGRLGEAVLKYKEALGLNPDFVATRKNLGLALSSLGRHAEAIEHYQAAIRLEPQQQFITHVNLADAYRILGLYREAMAEFRILFASPSVGPDALISFARLRATAADPAFRNGAQAVSAAEQVRGVITSDSLLLLDTLAAAYAEAGRFDEAVLTAADGLKVAERLNRPEDVKQFQARLELYKARQPLYLTPPMP